VERQKRQNKCLWAEYIQLMLMHVFVTLILQHQKIILCGLSIIKKINKFVMIEGNESPQSFNLCAKIDRFFIKGNSKCTLCVALFNSLYKAYQ
jgi:hypothetical protein